MVPVLIAIVVVLALGDVFFCAWLLSVYRANMRREVSWRRLVRAQNRELRRVGDEIASRV